MSKLPDRKIPIYIYNSHDTEDTNTSYVYDSENTEKLTISEERVKEQLAVFLAHAPVSADKLTEAIQEWVENVPEYANEYRTQTSLSPTTGLMVRGGLSFKNAETGDRLIEVYYRDGDVYTYQGACYLERILG